MIEYTREDIIKLLGEQGEPRWAAYARELIDGWIERGDGCAVYRNEDLSHPQMGHLQFVSFGGQSAQLGVGGNRLPPIQLPDVGDSINWRYVLIGTYRARRN